jgi:UDP:flavonoid glycosyltransferase YjiC (YdhE family)
LTKFSVFIFAERENFCESWRSFASILADLSTFMKISIFALGSRGDVQPYIALGNALQRAGQTVQMISTAEFRHLCEEYHLPIVIVGAGIQQVANQLNIEQGNFLQIMRKMGVAAEQMAVNASRAGLEFAKDSDLLISGLGGLFIALALSQKLGTPLLQAHLLPIQPTRAFPSVLTPQVPRVFNRISHQLARQAVWQPLRSSDNRARREVLQLPPAPFWGPFQSLEQSKLPILIGISPAVLPQPTDWSANIRMTGFWFLPTAENWQAPNALVDFIQAGDAPLYIGFGSMLSQDPKATAELFIRALKYTGQRAVFSAGWGGLQASDLPKNIYMSGYVPHEWLFPRMAGIVHHGGVGTTASAFASGVPSWVTPFFGDQPFWGQRAYELGVAPAPIAKRNLTMKNVSERLMELKENPTFHVKAQALGETILREDGLQMVVSMVESFSIKTIDKKAILHRI